MLKGRTALITGSVTGIGLKTAELFASRGCNIALNGFAPKDDIERQRGGLEHRHGIRAHYFGADLADPKQIEDMIGEIVDVFGSLHILVNNAAVRYDGPVETYTAEKWNHSLAVNLSGPFHAIRLSLPHMRSLGWGRIVNISSVLGLIGATNRIDYVTVKTALIGMTRAVAMETLGSGITCNAICPGFVHTGRTEARIVSLVENREMTREQAMRTLLDNHPGSGRFVETIPDVIAFLCSDAARDMTGITLPVDDGYSAGATSPASRRG